MSDIIFINGNVSYSITLDPGVWIFDDRKVDLLTYFEEERSNSDELEAYKKAVSAHWDREIREGALFPPVNKSISRFEKEKIIKGTFGIPLRPFLEHAMPGTDAQKVLLKTEINTYTLTMEEAMDAILGFSKEGKPLQDGPAHFYFGDGRNKTAPITHIRQLTVI
ncbi:peptidyl-prolyl cis-trans isomerase [Ectobacillus antri]|jgi:hypothetical protein|uniref:Peptidyl-prolyl cis-trans isomerase n=1 Tax=Ectobacillus antri TaxID=2486280 RepID=A0ABT6H1Z7_9BACI|nr:peptidyl-prolyl cis-trans isomerase [Ectobacillus antri]MDG4655796.1 peptidyl-prolyl cis-trans isomerase [Ectobacillus antri]MDG5752471.1 peptidyl-prolyl cis-trans isomerase [Ectobacillus antri]